MFKKKDFTRKRIFTIKVILYSLLIGAQQGFQIGYKQIIACLFEHGVLPTKGAKLPSHKAFTKACDKLPIEVVTSLISDSHQHEFADNGRKYHDLKIIIADGTKILLPRSPGTLEQFGEGHGHYPQCLAVGFFELSTGSIEDFKIAHKDTSERALAYEHMRDNKEKSLYMLDAGYSGMGFIALSKELGHEVLMPLKNCKLVKEVRSSKKRSHIKEIKLTNVHLRKYPEYKHLVGQKIKIRLVRTLGTTKLKSQVLITTLLDEKEFHWKELSTLYRQRYLVEIAYRHLKKNLCLENINKQKLSRINKFLFAAILLYNLAVILRNRIKVPEILPEKEGTKMYCFSFCLNRVSLFCLGVIRPKRGIKKEMANCLRALKSCWFIHKPWRASPRICHTPPTKFQAYKGKKAQMANDAAEFLNEEYQILGVEYGQTCV